MTDADDTPYIDGDALPDDIADDIAALADSRVRMRYWKCPVHWTYVKAPGNPAITVEWRGGVAYCLHTGCKEDSSAALPLDDARPLKLIPQFLFEHSDYFVWQRDRNDKKMLSLPDTPRPPNTRETYWGDSRD